MAVSGVLLLSVCSQLIQHDLRGLLDQRQLYLIVILRTRNIETILSTLIEGK